MTAKYIQKPIEAKTPKNEPIIKIYNKNIYKISINIIINNNGKPNMI
jgi:hypothetical protein